MTLSDSIEVETPELVVVSYTIAGLGSRAYAAVFDIVLVGVLLILVNLGVASLGPGRAMGMSGVWALSALLLLQFVIVWGYYVLFEALNDGQTPGKRALRLRVVRDGGYSVTFAASAVRNLVRIIDMQPIVFYAVGMSSLIVSRLGKRLGDYAAGTIVVQEDTLRQAFAVDSAAALGAQGGTTGASEPPPLHTHLTEAEYTLLERYTQRSKELDANRQTALEAQLITRFSTALSGVAGATHHAQLVSLYESERAARARGVAHRGDTGAARERHAIVAKGSARWAAFAARLTQAQRRGLKGMYESDVRDFVREYREIAADLARLRTAARGADSSEVFYLNRLIAGAHNLLYRRRTIPPREIINFLFVAVPREIRASAVPVLLAAALFFGPAAISYTAVMRDPMIAHRLLPPSMVDRADDGVRRAQTGDGYIDDPQVFRPYMASAIVANNIQVSFGAFAGGISAGTLTSWVLLSNGVSIGAVSGLYASKGIGSLLLAFVAPHGVLELTAICIAGGAGFLLAAALLIPGDRTRRAALAANGRRAIRLVCGATFLLVIAGSIEGFISPIPWWPLAGKLAVSGVTAVFLYVYLRLATGQSAPRALSSR